MTIEKVWGKRPWCPSTTNWTKLNTIMQEQTGGSTSFAAMSDEDIVEMVLKGRN
jgi:hypothetical protein